MIRICRRGANRVPIARKSTGLKSFFVSVSKHTLPHGTERATAFCRGLRTIAVQPGSPRARSLTEALRPAVAELGASAVGVTRATGGAAQVLHPQCHCRAVFRRRLHQWAADAGAVAGEGRCIRYESCAGGQRGSGSWTIDCRVAAGCTRACPRHSRCGPIDRRCRSLALLESQKLLSLARDFEALLIAERTAASSAPATSSSTSTAPSSSAAASPRTSTPTPDVAATHAPLSTLHAQSFTATHVPMATPPAPSHTSTDAPIPAPPVPQAAAAPTRAPTRSMWPIQQEQPAIEVAAPMTPATDAPQAATAAEVSSAPPVEPVATLAVAAVAPEVATPAAPAPEAVAVEETLTRESTGYPVFAAAASAIAAHSAAATNAAPQAASIESPAPTVVSTSAVSAPAPAVSAPIPPPPIIAAPPAPAVNADSPADTIASHPTTPRIEPPPASPRVSRKPVPDSSNTAASLLGWNEFERFIRAQERDDRLPGCVLYGDMDQLHVLNKLAGFATGDRAISEAGGALQTAHLPPGPVLLPPLRRSLHGLYSAHDARTGPPHRRAALEERQRLVGRPYTACRPLFRFRSVLR